MASIWSVGVSSSLLGQCFPVGGSCTTPHALHLYVLGMSVEWPGASSVEKNRYSASVGGRKSAEPGYTALV